jgi:hypothetical protein
MKRPPEFDEGFEITFNTIDGKSSCILEFQEFLGSYYFNKPNGDCFTGLTNMIYDAVKHAKVRDTENKPPVDI